MLGQCLALVTAVSALTYSALALQHAPSAKELRGKSADHSYVDAASETVAEERFDGFKVPDDEQDFEYAKFAYLASVWPSSYLDEFLLNQTGYSPTMTLLKDGGNDVAKVYKKDCTGDFCKRCVVTFSGTNDQADQLQVFNSTIVDFCGVRVHGGVADEMRQYYDVGLLGFSQSVSASKCERVYAVGHSFGGSLASLYAYCANLAAPSAAAAADKAYFAPAGPNVRLVVLGNFPVAEEPLYNGFPGNCFEGARFVVSQDGAMRPGEAPHAFYESFFATVSSVTELSGQSESASVFNQTVLTLSALDADGTSDSQEQYNALVSAMTPLAREAILSIGTEVLAGTAPNFFGIIGALLGQITSNTETLQFEWDPIGSVQFGPASVFLHHALVQYVQLAHPGTASATKTWKTSAGDFIVVPTKHPASWPKPATCDAAMATWPLRDQAVGLMAMLAGILLSGGALPNHQTCCYATEMGLSSCDADYGALYSGAVCPKASWR